MLGMRGGGPRQRAQRVQHMLLGLMRRMYGGGRGGGSGHRKCAQRVQHMLLVMMRRRFKMYHADGDHLTADVFCWLT